ncbi:MAG: hypothetical protein PHW04_04145 [Candidatus Wallbacteria bacterium]|nr:hypothetical protein [Candidatus Wallbacteria bacterium]
MAISLSLHALALQYPICEGSSSLPLQSRISLMVARVPVPAPLPAVIAPPPPPPLPKPELKPEPKPPEPKPVIHEPEKLPVRKKSDAQVRKPEKHSEPATPVASIFSSVPPPADKPAQAGIAILSTTPQADRHDSNAEYLSFKESYLTYVQGEIARTVQELNYEFSVRSDQRLEVEFEVRSDGTLGNLHFIRNSSRSELDQAVADKIRSLSGRLRKFEGKPLDFLTLRLPVLIKKIE